MTANDLIETSDKAEFEPSALVEYGDADQLTRISGGQATSTVEGPQYTS